MSKLNYTIHPTAIVDEPCKIGNNTKIWHFTHIMSHCDIGENCIIGQNVFLGNNVVLGNNCKVQNNVSLFDGVICEEDVFIGPSVVFTNVINPRAFIERKDEYQDTLLKKGASIGANATIICGVNIGSYAMVGAASVVTKDVPDFAIVKGNPAKQTGWISKAGAKLHFKNNKAVCEIEGDKYTLIPEKNILINE